jgi:hypothetical protein
MKSIVCLMSLLVLAISTQFGDCGTLDRQQMPFTPAEIQVQHFPFTCGSLFLSLSLSVFLDSNVPAINLRPVVFFSRENYTGEMEKSIGSQSLNVFLSF